MKLECPSYLIIGHKEDTSSEINKILKKTFCSSDCPGCTVCEKIKDNKHANIIWLAPEKSTYTKDQLDIIFQKCSFALEQDEKFFFIISQAELLNASSSNRLLKIIEEPPTGFHFFFLTSRAQDILPTIKSRCISKDLLSNTQSTHTELLSVLKQSKIDPLRFLQILEKSSISEKESISLVEELIAFWAKTIRTKSLSNQNCSKENKTIDILSKALLQPPMSGSSKVFWKNVVIQLSR
jgi:DNA polymerase III gamma/tau subunit